MSRLNQSQCPQTIPLYKKITLSSSQILNLQATPITVVAAPGAGKMLVPVFAFIKYLGQGQTAYNVAGGGDLVLKIGTNDPFGVACSSNENILAQTSNNISPFHTATPITNGDFDLVSTMENLPIKIANAGAGEYTTGTGTAEVTVHYLEVPI